MTRETRQELTGLVQVAGVGTGTVCIHLVDRDVHRHALLDRRNALGGQLILGLFSNVDVACQLGSATAIDNVLFDLRISDDGAILLARGNVGAVPCKRAVDCIQL